MLRPATIYAICAVVVSGCVVDRTRGLDQFACDVGGPCDGGTNGGTNDGGTVDATTADAGEDRPVCLGAIPLPNDGIVLGSNFDYTNSYDGPCFQAGGRDSVYEFDAPGRLASLSISLAQSDYDTSLHLYRGGCQPVDLVACNDDDLITSAVHSSLYLEDLPAGRYAAVVDAYSSEDNGSFVLSVVGAIAAGEPCDPSLEYMTCVFGTCGADRRCPTLLDCSDGIDADGDGLTDEDAANCSSPPTVACQVDGTVAVGSRMQLSAEAFGTVASRGWRIDDAPRGSIERVTPPGAAVATFVPDVGGDYTFVHVVADPDHQLSACSLQPSAAILPSMHVEMIWNADEPPYDNYRFVQLHMLHEDAPNWFDEMYDCQTPYCGYMPVLEWGPGGVEDDPYAVGGDSSPTGLSMITPQRNTTYRIGAEYEFDQGLSAALVEVRIFCNGIEAASVGPVTLQNGTGMAVSSDLWKIADVMWDGVGNCVVTVLGNPPAAPLIVSAAEAMTGR